MDYSKILAHTQAVEKAVRKELEARKKALNTKNKKFLVFDGFGEFVKGFDIMEEVEGFFTNEISKLWLTSQDNKELFGYFLPCDVKNMKEARVKNFYSVKIA